MELQEFGWVGTDWFDLTQDMDRCRAFVNAVMNLVYNKMRGISYLTEDLFSKRIVLNGFRSLVGYA